MKLTELSPDEYAALEATALAMLKEGAKQTEVRLSLGLNHSQLDLIVYRNQLTEQDFARFAEGGATLKERVTVARNQLGMSWGKIGLLAGEPETKVRKLYAEQSGNDSKGQRIGKGGRWLMNDHQLYIEELKPTGVVLPAGQVRNREFARGQARIQRIYKLDFAQLKELGLQYGVEHKKGQTKVTFTRRLIKAIDGEGTLTVDEATELVAEPKKDEANSAS